MARLNFVRKTGHEAGRGVIFEARYWGHCHACDERIVPGQDVTYTEDHELVHAVCVDRSDQPGRHERHCPDCFTIHAGECL